MRILAALLLASAIARAQSNPDVAAQRVAMQKLAFLVGTWSGDATAVTAKGPVKVRQTENVQFKLDGLVLTIEGTGRDPATSNVLFRAFATVAYDDAARVYHFRAYNDGRYLDTEMKVPDRRSEWGFEWGYEAGPAKVRFVMHLNNKGEWVETGEVTIGDQPARKTFDMTVSRIPAAQ